MSIKQSINQSINAFRNDVVMFCEIFTCLLLVFFYTNI